MGALGNAADGKISKKALRLMLQRMKASEILRHFLDVHQHPRDLGEAELACVFSPTEVVEIVCHELVQRLGKLAIACRHVPVPNKWLGSSVALGFECHSLPNRAASESAVREAVRVNVFDWGRSELNTLAKHNKLSESEQHDRAEFWNAYMAGIDRLFWEVSRAYRHRFSNHVAWKSVTFKIYDFDSISALDFLASVTVPVKETPVTTVVCRSTRSHRFCTACACRKSGTTLTYSMSWRALPASSRLSGVWRVSLFQIDGLQIADMKKCVMASDPICRVCAKSDSPHLSYWEETCVKTRNLNPTYNETFELPIARNSGNLDVALHNVGAEFTTNHFDHILPAHGGMHRYSYSRMQWKNRIGRVANAAMTKSARDARAWLGEKSDNTLSKGPELDPPTTTPSYSSSPELEPPTPTLSVNSSPARTNLSLKEALELYRPSGPLNVDEFRVVEHVEGGNVGQTCDIVGCCTTSTWK